MASENFWRVFSALTLFVLFSSLIVYGVVEMGNNYGVSSSEIGEGALDNTNFQGSIENVSIRAENYRARFESGDVDDVDDASGLFSVATDIISMIVVPFTLLASVMTNILNFPTMVVSVVLGLLSIFILLSIWSLLKKGD